MSGFTFTALITGFVCYALGMMAGWFINRSNNKPREKRAYERGKKEITELMAREKKIISQELNGKLETMRDSLVATYAAYEEAVQSVEDRLSPGAKDRLSLEHMAGSRHIGYEKPSLDDEEEDQIEEIHAQDSAEKKTDASLEDSTTDFDDEEEVETSEREFAATAQANGHIG